MEHFATWRAEIVAELVEAEAELSAAMEASAAASAAVVPLRDRQRATAPTLNLLPRHQHLAGALLRRAERDAADLRDAEIAHRQALNRVDRARASIADLQLAIEQLTLILPEPAVSEKRELVDA